MLPEWYGQYKQAIEEKINWFFDTYFCEEWVKLLWEFSQIIRYASTWWKRLRAILALEFYIQLSGKSFESIKDDDDIWKVCIALEIAHAFSLVHDDLPCMDNDELRRWQPTVWKKYGEYQAVIAGDTMSILAFEILSEIENPLASKKIIKTIAHALGTYGMCGWQIEDMYYESHTHELDIHRLRWLHGRKTGKLIEASIISWIILAWNEENLEKYRNFWKNLGLAFQIKDDILDVEWSVEETGKSIGWEEKWFVYLVWRESSKKMLQELIDICSMDISELKSEKLDFIVDYVANRKK